MKVAEYLFLTNHLGFVAILATQKKFIRKKKIKKMHFFHFEIAHIIKHRQNVQSVSLEKRKKKYNKTYVKMKRFLCKLSIKNKFSLD